MFFMTSNFVLDFSLDVKRNNYCFLYSNYRSVFEKYEFSLFSILYTVRPDTMPDTMARYIRASQVRYTDIHRVTSKNLLVYQN